MQGTDTDSFLTVLSHAMAAIPASLWQAAGAFILVWGTVRVTMAVFRWGDRQRDAYRRLDASAHKRSRVWKAITRWRSGHLLPAAMGVDEEEALELPFKTLCQYGDVLIATRGRHPSGADAGAAQRAFRVIQAEVIARRVEWAKTHDPITNLADGIRAALLERLGGRR